MILKNICRELPAGYAYIYLIEGDPRISETTGQIIRNPASEICLSVASLWEMAIKVSIGKLVFSRPLVDIFAEVDNQVIELIDIAQNHLLTLEKLPFHHKDPFDRLIIAQALSENKVVLSQDDCFDKYNVRIIR